MPIIKTISNLPDTKQGFSDNSPRLVLISGVFITKKTFTIPISDITDINVFYDAIENDDITPLHFIKEFRPNDEELVTKESIQDYSYKLRSGRYKHKLVYVLTLEKHQFIELLSDTDLNIIYYDRGKNIIMTSDDGVNARGFTTNRLILEKLLFPESTTPAFSILDIELNDSTELTSRGIIKNVTWQPSDVDRLFMAINIEYVDADTLNFSASYLGVDIDNIEPTDVTITDNYYGELSFNLFNYLGGVYSLSGFSSELISGRLEIKSTLYLGCARYTYTITVTPIVNNYDFDGLGEDYEFEDGVNYQFNN